MTERSEQGYQFHEEDSSIKTDLCLFAESGQVLPAINLIYDRNLFNNYESILDTQSNTKKSQIKLIGTRLGEKLYETLISREEMSRAVDLGEYYSIPYDNKNLNYSKYFSEGEEAISKYEDYTSHNTKRLNEEETKELLQSLDYIKDNL